MHSSKDLTGQEVNRIVSLVIASKEFDLPDYVPVIEPVLPFNVCVLF